MSDSSTNAFWSNFLGESPSWYVQTIILSQSTHSLFVAGPAVTGWALIGEFISRRAGTPVLSVQPGGLLAIEGFCLAWPSLTACSTKRRLISRLSCC